MKLIKAILVLLVTAQAQGVTWVVDCTGSSQLKIEEAGISVLGTQDGVDSPERPVCGIPGAKITGYIVKLDKNEKVDGLVNLGNIDFGMRYGRKRAH